MADSLPDRSSHEEAGVGAGRGATTGAPRWVKVFGVIGLVLLLLVVILLLTGGNHGPGRHASSGDARGQTAPSSVP